MPLPGLGAGMSAIESLGLGDMLRDEVMDESEELRKKRLLAQQNRGLLGPVDGAFAPQMLYGSMAGGGKGGGY